MHVELDAPGTEPNAVKKSQGSIHFHRRQNACRMFVRVREKLLS